MLTSAVEHFSGDIDAENKHVRAASEEARCPNEGRGAVDFEPTAHVEHNALQTSRIELPSFLMT